MSLVESNEICSWEEGKMNEYYFGSRKSFCHNAKCMIVQSRKGGFVSQDCVVCGKSFLLPFNQLPDINCKRCGHVMTKGFDDRGNYLYSCPHCHWSRVLWDMVPHWSELFEANGLGLDSDYDEYGQHKYKSYTRAY